MKKQSSPHTFFSKYEQYLKWAGLGIVAILAVMRFYYLPERLEAVEKKASTLEEILQAEKDTKEMMQKAPPGFQWNETVQDYVIWREDPRLKKK